MSSVLNERFLGQLAGAPAYCFTSDFDWAPESMIAEVLQLFASRGVPLTPFITNPSSSVQSRYAGESAADVGIHPNFRPGSTHGCTEHEVIDHAHSLWPQTRCFRSHGFVDSSSITDEFVRRGLQYDSNLCLNLQPGLVPLRHSSGLVRFPVFLEDDEVALSGDGWEIDRFVEVLSSPGLKVFNFHPQHICVNTPNMDRYAQIIARVHEDDWKQVVHEGWGARTLLLSLLDFVKDRPGLGVFSLQQLYRASTASQPVRTHAPTRAIEVYDRASANERSDLVKAAFDSRDGSQIYATSRDVNLRELEIDFIIDTLRSSLDDGAVPRVLDVGCGNGYTDLRIAAELDVDITGIDFSVAMLRGAAQLSDQFSARLRRSPSFELRDGRDLRWDSGTFDAVITERCIINLPDRETQRDVIRSIRRVLKAGGVYVAVEGTRDGLHRLNALRSRLGLDAIPDRDAENSPSLKFDEEDAERMFAEHFTVERRHYFGMYYLISRVVHPMLVAPGAPRFDAPINAIARRIAGEVADVGRLGHVMGYVLRAD